MTLKQKQFPIMCKIVGEENIPEIPVSVKRDSIKGQLFEEIKYLEKYTKQIIDEKLAITDEIEILRLDTLFCQHAYKVINKNTKEVYFSTQAILIY